MSTCELGVCMEEEMGEHETTSNLHYMPSILSPLNYPVVDLLVFSLQSCSKDHFCSLRNEDIGASSVTIFAKYLKQYPAHK